MDKRDRTIGERLAAIEIKLDIVCERTAALNKLVPMIIENSWWVGKIKWAFVFVAIVGVIGGVVSIAIRS